jgi:hypothetical protein
MATPDTTIKGHGAMGRHHIRRADERRTRAGARHNGSTLATRSDVGHRLLGT